MMLEEFRAKFKKARRDMGVSQFQVAVRSGHGQGHVSSFETGRKDCLLASILKMLDAFNMELTITPKKKEKPDV